MHVNKPHRKKDYDYNLPGAYFITICVKNRKCSFGNIRDAEMSLSSAGEIAHIKFNEIPLHHPDTEIGAFTIMPNHVHGIIKLFEEKLIVGQRPAFDHLKTKRTHQRVSVIVGSYKSGVTRLINKNLNDSSFEWQTSFHDHIIRNEKGLENVTNYIIMNPQMWNEDIENEKFLAVLLETERKKRMKEFYENLYK
jgi:putative transposase